MKAILKKIWNKLSLVLLWIGISLAIMIFGAIVIFGAAILLLTVPFLVLFPAIREKIWNDLMTGKNWGKEKRSKVEAKIVPISPQEPHEEDDSKYYYFSR